MQQNNVYAWEHIKYLLYFPQAIYRPVAEESFVEFVIGLSEH